MNVSEDIKLSIIIAFNLLFKKVDTIVLNKMYEGVDCKHIGYLIYVCTKILKNEKMNILRYVNIFKIGI